MNLPGNIDIICARAVSKWGIPSQEGIAIGEIGELLTLFGRKMQGRDSEKEWIDEIADGIIMLHQLAHIHGREAVEQRIAEKLPKLLAKIEKSEKSPDDFKPTGFLA